MRNDRVEEARRVIRADYWDSVRSFAQEALDAVKSGEVTDADGLTEYVEQSVDGSSWVIYNGQILDVLRFTENDEAFEECGSLSDMATGDGGYFAMLGRIAYFALLADVRGMPEHEEAVEALDKAVTDAR